jgi:broad specificity phosphatase PhoE
MRTTFLLVRHGDTDWIGKAFAGRQPGVHLNATGQRQAEALAGRLAGAGITALYSSPLERTVETAEPLARRLGLTITTRERFTEIATGDWTGETFEALGHTPRWQRFLSFRSSTSAPAGELMLEVQARAVTELEELRNRHPGATVAVFSHADVIRFVFAHYAGIAIDLAYRLEIRPASLSAIALGPEDVRILRLNEVGEP